MYLPSIIKTISKKLSQTNAQAIVVGGSVRDHFLGMPIKDYDIEVYGLSKLEDLEAILALYGSVNLVGKSFGILKFTYDGDEYDFSFPRVERKISAGHRGFDVKCDGYLSFAEASRRRDFTLNAMGYVVESGEFLDPFGGRKDMDRGLLRHISTSSFVEDPLRVYRAIQFGARFGYTLARKTTLLCQQMVADGMLEELPKERIYMEWVKLLLKSPKPSVGFELMRELDVLQYFPELQALIGIPQSPKWHPEGDVWTHTMMCVDAMARLKTADDKIDLKLMLAILCHDLGKATTTTIGEDGSIHSIRHEYEGLKPTASLLYRLTNEHDLIDSILPLVRYHLAPSQLYRSHFHRTHPTDKAIRRLATKVNISELVIVAKADFLGRTTEESISGIYPAEEWILEKASLLQVTDRPIAPILQGRDLIALGFAPSPIFGEILDRVYDLQLEGEVSGRDEAIEFAVKEFGNVSSRLLS